MKAIQQRGLILMRHAESEHNVAKNKIKEKYQLSSVKNSKQYEQVRVNPSLRDQLITQNGELQTIEASKNINWDRVQLILVSPMKRCLQTCKKMLQGVDKQIQVRVQPLLKGRLSNIWGYGSPVNDLKNQYPQYLFQSLIEHHQVPWFISIMNQEKQKLFKQLSKSKSKLYRSFKQDYHQFRERIFRLKSLIESIRLNLKQGSSLLIISHSCVLRTMVAKSFDNRGKGVSDFKFKNAKPTFLSFEQIFQYCYQGTTTCIQGQPQLNTNSQ